MQDNFKPPIIVHNRPKLVKPKNLNIVIINDNIDDPARYMDSQYRDTLSQNTIVSKDDESMTTIKMIEIDTSGQDVDVTWLYRSYFVSSYQSTSPPPDSPYSSHHLVLKILDLNRLV